MSNVGEIIGPYFHFFTSACGVLAHLGNKLPSTYTNWQEVLSGVKDML